MSNTNNTTKNGSTNYGTKRGGRRRGFTLIEILIVVVIGLTYFSVVVGELVH